MQKFTAISTGLLTLILHASESVTRPRQLARSSSVGMYSLNLESHACNHANYKNEVVMCRNSDNAIPTLFHYFLQYPFLH